MNAGRIRDLLLGVLTLALLATGLVVAYLSYSRALIPHRDVTLSTDVVGNALQVGSDVKLNGVPVGSVTEISATDDGADLRLALDPATLDKVPDNVVARLLPKTMFGERYVALVLPPDPSSSTLRAGDVIHQDASAEAAELQQVLDELLPVLQAIQPEKLSAMLSEFSEMLRGQGQDLGDAMVEWSHYVEKLTPHVPAMSEDLARLARVADQWNVAAPDLVDALSTMTTSMQTLVDEQVQLRDVYASVISSADTTQGWVSANHDTIEILSRKSRAALRATAPYASAVPLPVPSRRELQAPDGQGAGQGHRRAGHAWRAHRPAGPEQVPRRHRRRPLHQGRPAAAVPVRHRRGRHRSRPAERRHQRGPDGRLAPGAGHGRGRRARPDRSAPRLRRRVLPAGAGRARRRQLAG